MKTKREQKRKMSNKNQRKLKFNNRIMKLIKTQKKVNFTNFVNKPLY